ncbi:MAG: AAA family ATPase, partial [Akkermansia sp.]
MKIHDITIRNFRCFDALKLSFDDRLTILVGRNGAGKSAVLDAVAIAAGTL